MKRILFIITLCFAAHAAIWAEGISIKAIVWDNTNDEPMSFASVSVMQNDKLVKGTLTTLDGEFQFTNLQTGQYVVKFSMVGYLPVERYINLTGNIADVDLGRIALSENAQITREVEVVAQASQMRFDIDKKVFSVDQNLAAAGGSATDALENIPSVDVDVEGNISMRNNSNVEIWVNGKPAGLDDENRGQILEQMSAGDIDAIELITNPSAKYNPEGSAGIINLVMKKDRKAGFYGSVNAGLDYRTGAPYSGQTTGASINFNSGRWDGYASLGFRNILSGGKSESRRKYFDEYGVITDSLNQTSEQLNRMLGLNARVGFNYRINDRNTIGVSGFVMGGNRNGDRDIDYHTMTSEYLRHNTSTNNRLSGNATIDHTVRFDSAGTAELRTALIYSNSSSDNESQYLQEVLWGDAQELTQLQTGTQDNQNIELKSDFSKNWGKYGRLEAGLNIRYRSNTNLADGSDNGVVNPFLHDKFSYDEQIYALYANYGVKINHLSIQAGLRGEYIVTDNSSVVSGGGRQEYVQPFPSVFIAYSLPQNNELQFNYSRRINRPRGRQLNAFRDLSDSTLITYGNPDLAPEFASALELNHIKMWKISTLSTSLYYRYTDNVIQRVRFLDEELRLMNSTYMNVTRSQSAGLEMVYKISPIKWLDLTASGNLYYYSLMGNNFQTLEGQMINIPANENLSWSARLMANVMFTKTFSGQITGNYRSAQAVSQGTNRQMYTVDLGLRKTFLDRRLSLSLSVRDVLNSRRQISETEAPDFYQYEKNQPFSPTFRLSVSWNFGKADRKQRDNSNRERGDNDAFDEFEDF